jgi:hypothetical protein
MLDFQALEVPAAVFCIVGEGGEGFGRSNIQPAPEAGY